MARVHSIFQQILCPSSNLSVVAIIISLFRPPFAGRNGDRRPDKFSQKEQNASVRRQPILSRHGTALDGQTNSVKKNRIRLSIVNLSAIAGLERRSTARQIQSKRTEFFCPSSTRPKRTEFVCQSTTSAGRSSELQEQRMATHTKSNIHINRWDNCILLNATTPIIATHLFY